MYNIMNKLRIGDAITYTVSGETKESHWVYRHKLEIEFGSSKPLSEDVAKKFTSGLLGNDLFKIRLTSSQIRKIDKPKA
jgi:hypothetical protein